MIKGARCHLRTFQRVTFVAQHNAVKHQLRLQHSLGGLAEFLRVQIRERIIAQGLFEPGDVALRSAIFGSRHTAGEDKQADQRGQDFHIRVAR